MAGDALYWLEGRPAEDRTALVSWTADEGVRDLVPDGVDVESRVHEYGGGDYLADGDVVWFADAQDQRWYQIQPGDPPKPVTPKPSSPASVRYADARLLPGVGVLVAVRERHEHGNVVNDLVAIPADGSSPPVAIASGSDFFAFPRPSPDGRWLAWTSWDRPRMPWDGTTLWLAPVESGGRLGPARRVVGGEREAIFQPEWNSDGTLYFVSDRSGWWNLYRFQAGRIEPVARLEAELGVAQWELGYATYAFLRDGHIAAIRHRGPAQDLVLIDPASGRVKPVDLPYTSIKPYLATDGRGLALIGSSPTRTPTVALVHPHEGTVTALAGGQTSLDTRHISVPEPLPVATGGDETTYALYYRPHNPDVGPQDGLPPLVVRPHSGPTWHVPLRLDLTAQFLTNRGYAVADVDYRGSTGYGRAYRQRLYGRWGVYDVEDCVRVARYLARISEVDGGRVAISGASAGAYTVVRALSRSDAFAAGVARSVIADPASWREQAPKFQAHYIDRLVGDGGEQPSADAEQVSHPLLLLHGQDDAITPPSQARALVQALEKRGVSCTYLLFDGEGHILRREDDIRRALEAELAHYQRHCAAPET